MTERPSPGHSFSPLVVAYSLFECPLCKLYLSPLILSLLYRLSCRRRWENPVAEQFPPPPPASRPSASLSLSAPNIYHVDWRGRRFLCGPTWSVGSGDGTIKTAGTRHVRFTHSHPEAYFKHSEKFPIGSEFFSHSFNLKALNVVLRHVGSDSLQTTPRQICYYSRFASLKRVSALLFRGLPSAGPTIPPPSVFLL